MRQRFTKLLYLILILTAACATLFSGCTRKTSSPANESSSREESSRQPVFESPSETESSSQVSSEPSSEKESSSQASSEPSSEKESSSQASSEPSSETESSGSRISWSDYDNTSQGWGPGVHFNQANQPEAALSYQKKYDSLQASFIGSNNDDKVIRLTMDEGYENGYTEKILDVLKEKDCRAVFFITGSYAENNPELIRRMIDEGHVIGNHSWSHPADGMPSLSVDDQIADITKLHNYVKEHFNYEMTLFRNPAGIFSERSLAVTQSLGYQSMFWSFAYADWDPDKQPDQAEALKKLIDRLHPGALYLLHAVSATNTAILGDFIDQARSLGYEFELP